METLVGAFKECIDSQHIDTGPLSPLGDFYASSPNICKACKKRHAQAGVERYRARRKAAGLPSFSGIRTVEKVEREIHSRRAEESPDVETIEPSFGGEEVSDLLSAEKQTEDQVVGFQSETGGFHSLMKFDPFTLKGKPKPKYSRC